MKITYFYMFKLTADLTKSVTFALCNNSMDLSAAH